MRFSATFTSVCHLWWQKAGVYRGDALMIWHNCSTSKKSTVISVIYIFTLIAGFTDPWTQSQPSNMAMIKDLQVQCEKDMMRVRISFDRPFYGMVFSKGHYSNINCVHVPSGLGQTQVNIQGLRIFNSSRFIVSFSNFDFDFWVIIQVFSLNIFCSVGQVF